jgi:hypothetical protein
VLADTRTVALKLRDKKLAGTKNEVATAHRYDEASAEALAAV